MYLQPKDPPYYMIFHFVFSCFLLLLWITLLHFFLRFPLHLYIAIFFCLHKVKRRIKKRWTHYFCVTMTARQHRYSSSVIYINYYTDGAKLDWYAPFLAPFIYIHQVPNQILVFLKNLIIMRKKRGESHTFKRNDHHCDYYQHYLHFL